jgi:hypothetical protein
MTALKPLNLSQAQRDYAVANTPFFLLQKLRSNPAVQLWASHSDADQILRAMQRTLARTPKTLKDFVKPYAMLAALSMKGNAGAIRRATTLNASHHMWYKYLADALDQTSNSTTLERWSSSVPSNYQSTDQKSDTPSLITTM